MEIGERLKFLREKHGLSQAKLAKTIDTDQRYIDNWEKGSKIPHYIVESILKNFPDDFLWFLTGQEVNNINIVEMNKELKNTRSSLELSDKQELVFLKQDYDKIKIENETIKAENKALQTQMIRLEAQNELLREQNERLLSSVESGAKKYSTSGSNRESSTTEPLRKDL